MARRRRYVDPLAPLSQAEINAQAKALLASILGPQRQQIRRAQDKARQQAAEDAASIRGFGQVLAQMSGNTADSINKAYGDAATRQGAFSHGYATGQRLAEQHAADQGNQILQQQGLAGGLAPSQAADVMDYQGGQGAGVINQQGAAFGAAARNLTNIMGLKAQDLLSSRYQQGEQEQADLRQRLVDLNEQSGGKLADILDRLYSRELQKSAADTQRQYLGVAQYKAKTDRAATINPSTGQPYKNEQNQNKQVLAARKARIGALSSNRDKAYEEAQSLFKGTKIKNPSKNPQDVFKNPTIVQRPSYQQAYRQLYARFGQPLMRYAPPNAKAWWKHQIDAMIRGALTYAGFKRAPKPKPVPMPGYAQREG